MGSALTCALTLSPLSSIAVAQQGSSQDAISAAQAELTRLQQAAEMTNYDLISATVSLSQTEQLIAELDTRIGESSAHLDTAKQQLSEFVAQDYKNGSVSLIDIILNSKSMDDLVNRIVYANKIAERLRGAIDEVDQSYSDLLMERAALEQAQTDLENYIVAQSESLAAANEAAQAAQLYYDQLSNEMRQEIEVAQQTQRSEANTSSLEILASLIEDAGAPEGGGQASAGDAYAGGEEGSAPSEAAPLTNELTDADAQQLLADVSQTLGADVAAQLASSGGSYDDMLSRVYELLGSGYQYSGYSWTGSTDDSAFTCSGVVDYALGRDSQSSSPESLYEEVGSNMVTDTSSLNEGDLVFYSYGDREVGHVGVYIGDGYIIDSAPDGGVAIRDVDYMDFVGGGTLG